ncbi:MAG: hypothetical protein HY647_13205, partial [Acidobacteria bacterium]|nr:hypothetical protein [Acidobacteriota bacterium]
MNSWHFSLREFWYPTRSRLISVIVCFVVGSITFSCSRQPEMAKTELNYPQPRYPRYLVNPDPEHLLAAARFAVRQTGGMAPLGKIQSDQTVYVLLQWGQDMRVWEAMKQAWAEKAVEARPLFVWDVLGITEEEYKQRMSKDAVHGNEAWKELGNFRAEYKKFFPEDIRQQFGQPFTDEYIRVNYFGGYLDKHPEIQRFYAGMGGGTFWVAALGKKHGDKFMGNWLYIRLVDILSKAPEFPADVWNLVDEKILRPVPFVSEVTLQDPEGTNLHWTLTPEESQVWSKDTGISNHIYIYPNPLHSTMQEGAVLVAHANHTGIYPTMTVHVDAHGGIQSIAGGGRVGELFQVLINHPAFKEAKFPKSPLPGYWFFRQDGFA